VSPQLRQGLMLICCAVVLAGCETTSAEPDPTQVKLNDIDERLGRVERVVSNQSLLTLSQRIDVLEAQLREMRGNVEEMQNSNEALRKQQRDLYADLDRRLKVTESALKGGAAPGSVGTLPALPPAPGSIAGPAVAGDDQGAYNRAFDALKASDYNGAIAQFRDFLRLYPHSALADNAQYWLGEGFYVTRDYDDAIATFRALGDQYPQSRKAPDALVKIGFAQFELKHMADARATLNQVVQRYPGTDAAKLAADRLTKIPPGAP
jgi:tol-pal system protein YbgF